MKDENPNTNLPIVKTDPLPITSAYLFSSPLSPVDIVNLKFGGSPPTWRCKDSTNALEANYDISPSYPHPTLEHFDIDSCVDFDLTIQETWAVTICSRSLALWLIITVLSLACNETDKF